MLEDKSADNIRWLLEITQQTPDDVAALLNATSIFLDFRQDLRALEGRLALCYLVRAEQEKTVVHWARDNTPSAQVTAPDEHLMFWERADEFNRHLLAFGQQCIEQVCRNHVC